LENEIVDKVLTRKGKKVIPDADTLKDIKVEWDKLD
jgi:hypothetical protein